MLTLLVRESAQKWLELYFRFADDLAEIQSKNPTVEKHVSTMVWFLTRFALIPLV